MRIADLVFAFPTIILAMVVAASLGPSLTNAVIALLIVSWPSYARVMRSLVLGARAQEYVVAGRLLGASPFRSLGRDVLPNVAAPGARARDARLRQRDPAALRALVPRPRRRAADARVGSDGRPTACSNFSRWWIAAFPGLAIFTVVLGLQLPRRRAAGRPRPAHRRGRAEDRGRRDRLQAIRQVLSDLAT